MAVLLIASVLFACAHNAQSMRHKVGTATTMKKYAQQVGAVTESARPSCSDIIPSARFRDSSWRRKHKCKCPYEWVIGGDSPNCNDMRGERNFPLDENLKGCSCRHRSGGPAEFVDIENQKPKIKTECAVEYGFGDNSFHRDTLQLPDFLDSAHQWCDSKLVPESKRVPSPLRGLYWMKDLKLDDVAFCPSLGEWDNERLTLTMSVWNMFVFGKKASELVSHLAESAAHIPVFGGPLLYYIKFTNSSMTEASITTNLGLANGLVNFPMWELEQTPDGTIHKEKSGDVFYRWSSIAGFETGEYYPVRIMDDDGTKHMDRYQHMKDSEGPKGTTFQRFKSVCFE